MPGIGDIHCPPQQHRGHGLAPVLQRRARNHRHLLRDAVDVRRRDARTHPGRGLHGLDGSGEGIDVHKQEHPLFRRYVEKNRQGYQSTWLLPDGLGDHALLDGQDDIFIYAPYGKSYHKLIGNKRMENGDKTCWRGVYTWFETPIADDADLLCYEGSVGGHTAVFIDCKRACKRTLALPGYLDLRHFGTAEQNSGIRISAAGRNKLKIKAGAPGSCVLLLRE